MLTIQEILKNANLDVDQTDYLYDNVLSAWDNGDPNLIRILEAPMNSGKTTTMLMATVWAEVYRNPSCNLILYVAPRKELINDTYNKVHSRFDNKNLLCSDSSVKNIFVFNQEEFNNYVCMVNKTNQRTNIHPPYKIPSNQIIFATVSIQWLTEPKILSKVMNFDKGFIYADEPHIGLKIGDATSMMPDAGRYPSIMFSPTWLPAMKQLAAVGKYKILGSTATPSASQIAKTDSGKDTFFPLAVMPKRDFKTCFPVLHPSKNVYAVYDNFKEFWPNHLKKTTELINNISADTWSKSAAIGIIPCMPLYFVKGGAENAKNGIPFFVQDSHFGSSKSATLYNDLWNFHRNLNSDSIFSISTSYLVQLEKKSKINYVQQHVRDLNDIMEVMNDPNNNMYDGGLGVINSGTAGMNVHRFDTVVYLCDPDNLADIADSQVQALGRIMRFPFPGMRSHADMREKINNMDIELPEKYRLCEYVVHKCLNHVFYVDSKLMNIAVDEFTTDTMTRDGAMEYYFKCMTSNISHHKQSATTAPSISLQYDASALNATYKKQHCECCDVIDSNGTTTCERDVRANLEKLKGPLTDEHWAEIWFKVLHLHHKDVNHFNYDPDNLLTVCPNMHMAITIFEGHATKRYP